MAAPRDQPLRQSRCAISGLHLPDFDWNAACAAAADAGDSSPTWAYRWRVGAALAGSLTGLAPPAGRRVVDLGCGRGTLGLAALTGGAREVLFADASPQVLAWIATVLQANGLEARARPLLHRWGDPLPDGPWDLVLGGDILYRPECFEELVATLAAACAEGAEVLLADPRRQIDEAFTDRLPAAGIAWRQERRDDSWTLLRLIGAPDPVGSADGG